MRTITNNVPPAVTGRGVGIDELTAQDLEEGIQIASRQYKLFQAKVGLFRPGQQPDTVALGEVTTVTCLPNQAFPRFLIN